MRIVVKVGTSTLAHATGRLNIQRMERLCKVLSDLKNAGHEIILVSSGAIGMGVGKLSLSARPKDMPTKQAAAAIGQCELMYFYDKLFSEYNHIVAQLLITAPDLAEGGSRKAHFHNTLARLLALGAPTRSFSRSRATKARSLPPAAWAPSCTRRRSPRRPAARWSSPMAKSPRCSMISSAASASAQDS